jgi:hypothetical protein
MLPGGPPYSSDEERPDQVQGVRKVAGITLLAVGTVAAILILQRVLQILAEGAEFPLIDRLLAGRRAIETPAGEVILPENAFVLAAYGVVIVLLGIASGLAKALLQGGLHLIGTDVRTLITALRQERYRDMTTKPPGQA